MSENRDLGEVVLAGEVLTGGPGARRMRTIILLLAASVALMMTGFGIIMPVFARRLGELGGGVEALGLMTMSFALAQLMAAPFMGSLADRWGRRPLVLVALAAFAVANVGFLLAPTIGVFVLVRFLEGGLTAGLFPAAMGIVSDVVPERDRARWIGIVMGGYGAGFVFGPVIGGFLYDGYGFAAPFVASAVLAVLALLAAFALVPETRTPAVRRREALRHRRAQANVTATAVTLWDSLPRPLLLFAVLLFVDFAGAFAFAFVEPQMVFYLYEDLDWTTVQFGIVVGAYGLAMVFGQTMLGQASDRFGRKPVIVAGILLNMTLYASLAFLRAYPLILATSVVAGFGSALIGPAVSAYHLDITSEAHKSRVVGIKESALALGGVAGPLLVAAASRFLAAQGIFIAAGAVMLLTAGLALALLRPPQPVTSKPEDLTWEVARSRSLAAQASLRGVVMRATAVRADL